MNHFSQLSKVHRVSDVRQTEINTPERSPFEFAIAISELKRYKSSGIDQILGEMIQAEGETIHSKCHKLVHSIWNKEELFE
jgi:hypothetical protein